MQNKTVSNGHWQAQGNNIAQLINGGVSESPTKFDSQMGPTVE